MFISPGDNAMLVSPGDNAMLVSPGSEISFKNGDSFPAKTFH